MRQSATVNSLLLLAWECVRGRTLTPSLFAAPSFRIKCRPRIILYLPFPPAESASVTCSHSANCPILVNHATTGASSIDMLISKRIRHWKESINLTLWQKNPKFNTASFSCCNSVRTGSPILCATSQHPHLAHIPSLSRQCKNEHCLLPCNSVSVQPAHNQRYLCQIPEVTTATVPSLQYSVYPTNIHISYPIFQTVTVLCTTQCMSTQPSANSVGTSVTPSSQHSQWPHTSPGSVRTAFTVSMYIYTCHIPTEHKDLPALGSVRASTSAPAHEDREAHKILISPRGLSSGVQGAQVRAQFRCVSRRETSCTMVSSCSSVVWQVTSSALCRWGDRETSRGMRWHNWGVSDHGAANLLFRFGRWKNSYLQFNSWLNASKSRFIHPDASQNRTVFQRLLERL
jgi:hypothetical protein